MILKMEIWFAILAVLISTSWAASSDSDGDDSSDETSTYANSLYKKLSDAGILNTLFNTGFKRDDIKSLAYFVCLYYGNTLHAVETPQVTNRCLNLADVTVQVFKNDVPVRNWFLLFPNSFAGYLKENGYLTPDNGEEIAKRHFEELQKIVNLGLPLKNPAYGLLAVITGNSNFLKSFGTVPQADVFKIFLTWVDNYKHLIKN